MSIKRERESERMAEKNQTVSLFREREREKGYLERQGHSSKKEKVFIQRETTQRERPLRKRETLQKERERLFRKRESVFRETVTIKQEKRERLLFGEKSYLVQKKLFLERE